MTTPILPLVCIIPVHNDAAHIGRAIDSLLGQSAPPSRILVVDDASSDALGDALAPFGERIQYHRQDHAGPAVARNWGVATGDEPLVAFLDADDRLRPDRLARAQAKFAASPDVGISVCMAQNVDDADQPLGIAIPAYIANGLVVRRSAFQRIGEFDPMLPHGGPLDWFIRARRTDIGMALDPEALLIRHLRKQSFSNSNMSDSHREHLHVVRESLRHRRAAGTDGGTGKGPSPHSDD